MSQTPTLATCKDGLPSRHPSLERSDNRCVPESALVQNSGRSSYGPESEGPQLRALLVKLAKLVAAVVISSQQLSYIQPFRYSHFTIFALTVTFGLQLVLVWVASEAIDFLIVSLRGVVSNKRPLKSAVLYVLLISEAVVFVVTIAWVGRRLKWWSELDSAWAAAKRSYASEEDEPEDEFAYALGGPAGLSEAEPDETDILEEDGEDAVDSVEVQSAQAQRPTWVFEDDEFSGAAREGARFPVLVDSEKGCRGFAMLADGSGSVRCDDIRLEPEFDADTPEPRFAGFESVSPNGVALPNPRGDGLDRVSAADMGLLDLPRPQGRYRYLMTEAYCASCDIDVRTPLAIVERSALKRLFEAPGGGIKPSDEGPLDAFVLKDETRVFKNDDGTLRATGFALPFGTVPLTERVSLFGKKEFRELAGQDGFFVKSGDVIVPFDWDFAPAAEFQSELYVSVSRHVVILFGKPNDDPIAFRASIPRGIKKGVYDLRAVFRSRTVELSGSMLAIAPYVLEFDGGESGPVFVAGSYWGPVGGASDVINTITLAPEDAHAAYDWGNDWHTAIALNARRVPSSISKVLHVVD